MATREPLDLEFENFNPYRNMEVLKASTAEELLRMIKSSSSPLSIKAIYAQGQTHYAWVQGDIQVKKTMKKGK